MNSALWTAKSVDYENQPYEFYHNRALMWTGPHAAVSHYGFAECVADKAMEAECDDAALFGVHGMYGARRYVKKQLEQEERRRRLTKCSKRTVYVATLGDGEEQCVRAFATKDLALAALMKELGQPTATETSNAGSAVWMYEFADGDYAAWVHEVEVEG
jgi:hypothetical protein